METHPDQLPEIEAKPGFLGTFTLGCKVWAREMRRLLASQAKLHEVRQLEARLSEEMALLAKLEAASGPEKNLCLRQVEMLKIEIARLRREQEAASQRPPCQPGAATDDASGEPKP
ncbi:MAG: hypothetical protein HY916_08855 [Desulfovibrio sp.]|jgi:hypothetical protein|nr:hypothetical protein [Desulfovibrio sp.]